MTLRRSAIAGAFFGMTAGLSWLAFAQPMDPPPPQWIACVAHGEGECASGGADTISWADAETDLRIIQDWTNRSLHYRVDHEDIWMGFALPGQWWADCEDYALTIRREAMAQGYPADALRLMTLWNGSAIHAVLVVYTHDAGPMVFDPLLARGLCRISECQRRTLKVWRLDEYVTLPGIVPLAIYEPGGTWRFTTEFYVEDTRDQTQ